jgi:L-gulono-1,4-lactone dehydrogenase
LTWRNHTGNQSCDPRSIEEPGSLEQLVDLVRRAEEQGTTVRAVGAHHAWSDVALTDGLLIEPDELGGSLLPLQDACLKRGPDNGSLVWVLAGTRLRQLNPLLEEADLALPNMGGYDAQTVAGVVSTSTHGSGLQFAPFPDMVRSLDVVVAGGEVVRVEPADGPTDAAAFAHRHGDARRLIQDDKRFEAAICGIGCMGVIHAFLLAVRPKFWLNEVRTLSTWEDVKDSLTADGVLKGSDHYELFLNPYPRKDGKHSLLVTIRRECEEPVGARQDKLERHPLTELQSAFPLTWVLVRLAARWFPSLVAKRFEWLLDRMTDDGYAARSYAVFNIGEANKIPAYSSELAVTLQDGTHIRAVDRILQIAAEQRAQERLYHTSPIALRFVAPSKAYASMMHGQPTMMIELIMAKGTRRWERLLAGYEERLADLRVRPHWGQYNTLNRHSDLEALYPRWSDWLDVYAEFNASGVFNSPFTDRIGISRSPAPEPETR